MIFAEFIARFRCIEEGRAADVLRPDFDVLHAIELGRRHSGVETLPDLLRAARREAGMGRRLHGSVEFELTRLWSLFERAAPAGRRKIGL